MMNKFFLKSELTDNKTSYLSTLSNGNKYIFNNISEMIKSLYKEYTEGIAQDSNWETKNPDWNKVLLVPVTTSNDSYGNVLKIVHDISFANIKLRGGHGSRIPIQVVTSKFKN